MSDAPAGVVVFDPAAWRLRFPAFAAVPSDDLAQAYFNEACMILNNTSSSQVTDLAQRSILLNLLTAHIATLNGWPAAASGASGGASSGAAGILTSATEGSVSASFQPLAGADATALRAWLSQTQYGAEYYALTVAYRSMRYYVGRQPYLGVGPRYLGARSGYWW